MPRVPAENLKMQVTEVSWNEVFGESGWRGSIRLEKLVSRDKSTHPKTLPRTLNKPKNAKSPNIEEKKTEKLRILN